MYLNNTQGEELDLQNDIGQNLYQACRYILTSSLQNKSGSTV